MVTLSVADTLAGTASRALTEDRFGDAIAALRTAARWNPMDMDYARGWGSTALRLADRSEGDAQEEASREALAAYQTNIRKEPENGTWHSGAALALSYLNPEAAVRRAMKAVELSPLSSHAWWSLSRSHRASYQTFQEKTALQIAISIDPIVPEPYIRLAEIFREEGKPEDAEQLLMYAADTWRHREDLAPWRGRPQASAEVVEP